MRAPACVCRNALSSKFATISARSSRSPQALTTTTGAVRWKRPLAILVSGGTTSAAEVLAGKVLDKPKHSVVMTKETVNAYAGLGAHAVSYMAHDQLELAAASPESRAARASALQKRKK